MSAKIYYREYKKSRVATQVSHIISVFNGIIFALSICFIIISICSKSIFWTTIIFVFVTFPSFLIFLFQKRIELFFARKFINEEDLPGFRIVSEEEFIRAKKITEAGKHSKLCKEVAKYYGITPSQLIDKCDDDIRLYNLKIR